MAILSFGFTSYKFIYPIIGGIVYAIRSYSFEFFKKHPYSCSPLFKLILMDFGMLLSFIFEAISLCRQSRKRSKESSIKEDFKYFFTKYKDLPSSLFFLLLMTILDFSGVFLNSLLSFSETPIDNHLLSIARLSEFFFVILLYYFFFKQSLHRHQFIALVFIISGLLLFCIKGAITFNAFIFISILANFLTAILEVSEKWIMDIRYLSPFEVVGFQGLFGMIILSIILIISNFAKCQKWMAVCEYDEYNPKNIIDFWKDFNNIFSNSYTIFEVFSYITLTTAYNILFHLLVKHLGPTHRIISDGLASIITMTVSIFILQDYETSETSFTYFIISQVIGHFCIIIGIVLYNEIIIANFCGLELNTDKAIKERANQTIGMKGAISFALLLKEQEEEKSQK